MPNWIYVSVEWLDTHSGAVTALGTVGLLLVTALYVVLTRRIAKSTDEQADVTRRQTKYLQDQERRHDDALRRTVWARAAYLSRKLGDIPAVLPEPIVHKKEALQLGQRIDYPQVPEPGWHEEDERALGEAASVFPDAIIDATEAIRGLEIIRKDCLAILGHNRDGRPVVGFSVERWTRASTQARVALTRLEGVGAAKQ